MTHILYVDDNTVDGEQLISDIDREAKIWPIEKDTNTSLQTIRSKIADVSLVLMDYDLHHDNEESDETAVDGLELLERFRATFRHTDSSESIAPVLVLFSGELEGLAKSLKCPSYAPFLAKLAKVDWVFPKGPKAESNTSEQIQILFEASIKVQRTWSDDDSDLEPEVREILGLKNTDSSWPDQAFEGFRELRPPLQSLQSRNDSAALIRWLLQVAIPFPSCLIDIADIAILLRSRPDSLVEHYNTSGSKLREMLEPYIYTGILSNFDGPRFWRSGIMEMMWLLRGGTDTQSKNVFEELNSILGGGLQPLEVNNPVVISNPDTFQRTTQIASMDDAAQLQPDDWPLVLDSPWVLRDIVKNNKRLQALLVNEDRDLAEEA